MRTIERVEIELKDIHPHPWNREFATRGEVWDDFEDDIAARGIMEDLEVRPRAKGGFECLKGHRRRHAGLKRGIERAWCLVRECSDEEAFDLLCLANMRRENLTPYDEAQAVRVKIDEFGRTVEEIAAEWNHSAEWVRTRQRMLDLGDEVLDAVRRPGRDRLPMGSVEEILRCPEPLWPQAVQLVLSPVLQVEPLSPDQARDVLKKHLLEPAAREQAWEEVREKLGKAWRKDLEKLCRPGTKEDLVVLTRPLKDIGQMMPGMLRADEAVPMADCMPGAPAGLLWLHLAVRHGMAVQVVPAGEGGKPKQAETKPVVDSLLLRQAEAAAAEHGAEHWLVTAKKRVENQPAAPPTREERAKAVAAGEGDPAFQDDPNAEPVQEVIEQRMESRAWVDLGVVRDVAAWAKEDEADPASAPDYVPEWVKRLAYEGDWKTIDEAMAWILSLKDPGAAG